MSCLPSAVKSVSDCYLITVPDESSAANCEYWRVSVFRPRAVTSIWRRASPDARCSGCRPSPRGRDRPSNRRRDPRGCRRDRKSVVSGKGVSVRVDLGGRRIIKKKKHKPIHSTSSQNKNKQQKQ